MAFEVAGIYKSLQDRQEFSPQCFSVGVARRGSEKSVREEPRFGHSNAEVSLGDQVKETVVGR